MTPSGIEPATFRFVAQYVYNYYYCENNKGHVNKLCGQNIDLLLLNVSVHTVTVCLYKVAFRNIHA
jgi:hypothetical protein